MSRIKTLTLENFKFFYSNNEFNFNGNNILLYGENGSGKSSIYWSIYTLLQSSNKPIDKIQKYFDIRQRDTHLLNRFANENDGGKISIETNDNKTFTISNVESEINTIGNTDIKEASIGSDFINYKLLAKLYDFKHSNEINLFDLFISDIFDYMKFDETRTYSKAWNDLKKYENEHPSKNTWKYYHFDKLIEKFNRDFSAFLASIISNINDILHQYFYDCLEVEYNYIDLKYDDDHYRTKYRKLELPKVTITLKYNHDHIPLEHNKNIHKPHSFLNEAKLTAIALSIRLAILRTRIVSDGILKILVLDDLLISLDMNNRDIVLNMLINDEYLKDYQIIMLTHDKAFFEVAKNKFDNLDENTWEYLEMYEDTSEDIPKPLVIHSDSYFKKAEKYFRLCDYQAAGNYLRKASEETIKSKLLNTFRPSDKDGLDRAIQNYEVMCKEFNIPISEDIEYLKEFTKRVFNPSSHDDLVSPLYKKEIQDAIQVVGKLEELSSIAKSETKIKTGSILTFKIDAKYEVIYTFLGDVPLYTYGDSILNRESILLYKFKYKIFENGTWKESTNTDNTIFTLKDIFQRNKHFVKRFNTEIDKSNFTNYLKIDNSTVEEDIIKLIIKQIN